MIVVLILYLAIRNQIVAKSPVDTDNAWHFGSLVKDLVKGCETPSEEDEQTIAADLEKIFTAQAPFLSSLSLRETIRLMRGGKAFPDFPMPFRNSR